MGCTDQNAKQGNRTVPESTLVAVYVNSAELEKNVPAENIFASCTTTVKIIFPGSLIYEESVGVLSFKIGP